MRGGWGGEGGRGATEDRGGGARAVLVDVVGAPPQTPPSTFSSVASHLEQGRAGDGVRGGRSPQAGRGIRYRETKGLIAA